MTYKPLPDFLTIKPSPIHGLGLFATQDIPEGTNLGISLIKINKFESKYSSIKNSKDSKEIIRTPLGGFYNHSEKPNVRGETIIRHSGDETFLITTRDIKAGEEITGKYNMYNIKKE